MADNVFGVSEVRRSRNLGKSLISLLSAVILCWSLSSLAKACYIAILILLYNAIVSLSLFPLLTGYDIKFYKFIEYKIFI
jgi:hypothetical protein